MGQMQQGQLKAAATGTAQQKASHPRLLSGRALCPLHMRRKAPRVLPPLTRANAVSRSKRDGADLHVLRPVGPFHDERPARVAGAEPFVAHWPVAARAHHGVGPKRVAHLPGGQERQKGWGEMGHASGMAAAAQPAQPAHGEGTTSRSLCTTQCRPHAASKRTACTCCSPSLLAHGGSGAPHSVWHTLSGSTCCCTCGRRQEGASSDGVTAPASPPKHTQQAAHRTAAVAARKVRQGGVGQPSSSPHLLQLLWKVRGGVQPPAHDRDFGPVGDGVLRFGCMEWGTRSWIAAGQQSITATSACCTAKQRGI